MSAEAIRLLLLFGADRTAADAYGRLPVDVLPGGGVGQNGSVSGAVGRSSFLGVGQNGGEAGPGSGSGSRGGNSSSGGSSEGTSPPNEYNGRGGNHSSDDSLGHDDNGLNERGMMNGTTMNGTTMNGPKQSNTGHSSGNLSNEPDTETRLSDDFLHVRVQGSACSRTRAHDWTECPFTHPGEKARRGTRGGSTTAARRAPSFGKGRAAGGRLRVRARRLECWLHPSRYRTQLCKDGLQCARRACFFAHASHQLRPPTDAFGNVLAGGGGNRGAVEGMSGGHGGASYCQTVPVPGVHVSSGGGLGYSGHGSGNGSGSGSGNGSSGGSGGSNSPGVRPGMESAELAAGGARGAPTTATATPEQRQHRRHRERRRRRRRAGTPNFHSSSQSPPRPPRRRCCAAASTVQPGCSEGPSTPRLATPCRCSRGCRVWVWTRRSSRPANRASPRDPTFGWAARLAAEVSRSAPALRRRTTPPRSRCSSTGTAPPFLRVW